jgi:hypothetical protein
MTMNKLLAALPLALLASACAASGGAATTTTVVRTVTTTVTAPAPSPSSASSDDAGAADPGAADGSSAAAGSAPDACSLLTQAQAEKVASTKLAKPTPAGVNSSGAAVMCQFVGPTSGPLAELEIYVGDGAKQQLHIDRDNLKHTFTPVPGVGDQCLQEDGFIFVEKNGLWASLHLVRLNDPKQNVAPMRAGIAEIAARLP